jgi:MFS family permease
VTALRHRQFRLLWTGMSASLVGDGILLVALAWQVYDLFGVPAAMSAVGVALSVPQIVTLLFGGVISDRYDPRRIMLVSDTIRGLVMAGLAALSIAGSLTLSMAPGPASSARRSTAWCRGSSPPRSWSRRMRSTSSCGRPACRSSGRCSVVR